MLNLISMYLEIRKFKKTKSYREQAGAKYAKKNYATTTYQHVTDTHTDVREVKIKPPNGSFFGNVNGKTVSGYMNYSNSGSYFGNINGETVSGFMQYPKSKIEETYTTNRVVKVIKKNHRKKWRDQIIRRCLNRSRYKELQPALTVDDQIKCKIYIKEHGFNRGVEKFTQYYIKIVNQQRREQEIKEMNERRRKEIEADIKKFREEKEERLKIQKAKMEAEKAEKERIKENREKRRLAEEAKKKRLKEEAKWTPFNPNWRPTAEELTSYKKLGRLYPYTGISVRMYDATMEQGAFAAVMKYQGERFILINQREEFLLVMINDQAEKLSRKYGLEKNENATVKP